MSNGMVPVTANIDLEDKILFGLTARQTFILAPAALGFLSLWKTLIEVLPIAVLAVTTAPIAAVMVSLVLLRKDGTGLDRLVWAAIRMPRKPVAAITKAGKKNPDAPVGLCKGNKQTALSPAMSVVESIEEIGTLSLGGGRIAIGLDVGCINFALRSVEEQEVLVAAFARLLHGTDVHIQVITTARPMNLGGYITCFEANKTKLTTGPLHQAAHSHMLWLKDLIRTQLLLRRRTTVVCVAKDVETAENAACRVESFAQSIGTTATRLDADNLCARIRCGLDPIGTPTTLNGDNHV